MEVIWDSGANPCKSRIPNPKSLLVPVPKDRHEHVVTVREDRGADVNGFADSALDRKPPAVNSWTQALDDHALRERVQRR